MNVASPKAMKCRHCLTLLSSMRVLETGVAFVCEKCDRTLTGTEVLRPIPSRRPAPAAV